MDGKRDFLNFTCKEDVLKIVDLLVEEVVEANEKGERFDISQSINAQIPFFACRNVFIDKSINKDIERYVYCKELNVSPYKGSYGEQPALWVDRFFIIKNAMAKNERNAIEQQREKSKIGSK